MHDRLYEQVEFQNYLDPVRGEGLELGWGLGGRVLRESKMGRGKNSEGEEWRKRGKGKGGWGVGRERWLGEEVSGKGEKARGLGSNSTTGSWVGVRSFK